MSRLLFPKAFVKSFRWLYRSATGFSHTVRVNDGHKCRLGMPSSPQVYLEMWRLLGTLSRSLRDDSAHHTSLRHVSQSLIRHSLARVN